MKPRARKSWGIWTAAKLFGAILLAPVGMLMGLIYVGYASYDNDFGVVFWAGLTVFAAWIGWSFLGTNPGFGYAKSIKRGFASGVYVYTAGFIWQGTIFAYSTLTPASFDSPEIIPGVWMQSIIHFAQELFLWPITLTCIIGGVIVGRIVGTINWHWR